MKERPIPFELIDKIINRMDLLKNGILEDIPLTSFEASTLTGLSVETLRLYGRERRLSTFKYSEKRNGVLFFSCKELCLWMKEHYRQAEPLPLNTTPQTRRGRPKK